jgi:hypothetical protein
MLQTWATRHFVQTIEHVTFIDDFVDGRPASVWSWCSKSDVYEHPTQSITAVRRSENSFDRTKVLASDKGARRTSLAIMDNCHIHANRSDIRLWRDHLE